MSKDAEKSPSPGDRPPRWAKHAVWLGLVITLVGFVSYYTYFARFAAIRDVPWLNLPLVLMGLLVTAVGSWQLFRRRGGIVAKCLAGLAMLVVLGVAGLFNFYLFSLSYQLPGPAEALAAESPAPDFTLAAHDGRDVSLSDYRGRNVVLVFYRGFW